MPMFEALTDNGNSLQIGDTWMNYAFVQKLTVNTTARSETSDLNKEGGIVANTRAWSLDVTGNNPLLVVVGDNAAALLSRTQSGSTFTFKGWCGVSAGGAAITSFQVYVFDRPSVSGQGKILLINDASGNNVFDGTCKYLRVVGLINTAAGATSVSQPSGKTYGAILGGCGGKMQVESLSHGAEVKWRVNVSVSRAVVNVISGTVAAATRYFYSYVNYSNTIPNPVPAVGTYGDENLLSPVVDLTGY